MDNLLKSWSVSRWIRLVIGAGISIYSLYIGDYFLFMLGLLFAWLVVLNRGCCSSAGCGTSSTDQKVVYKNFVKPYRVKKIEK